MTFVSVAIGGALGAVARYALVLWAARAFGAGAAGAGAAVGVLVANVAGSAVMGFVAGALAGATGPALRAAPFVMTGFLGGFTTFSAFSLDAVAFAERGRLDLAALYVGVSVSASLVALVGGLALGRALFPGGAA